MAEKNTSKNAEVKKPDKKKISFFENFGKYFRSCIGEIKKIVWPTPKATFKNMGIVLFIIAVIGVFIFGLDRGLYALLRLVMDVSVS